MSSARSATKRRTCFSKPRFSANEAAVIGAFFLLDSASRARCASFVSAFFLFSSAAAVRDASFASAFAVFSFSVSISNRCASSNSFALSNSASKPDSLSTDFDTSSFVFEVDVSGEVAWLDLKRSLDRSESSAAVLFSSPGRVFCGERFELLLGDRFATPAGTKGTWPGSAWPFPTGRVGPSPPDTPRASLSSKATLSRNSRRKGSAPSPANAFDAFRVLCESNPNPPPPKSSSAKSPTLGAGLGGASPLRSLWVLPFAAAFSTLFTPTLPPRLESAARKYVRSRSSATTCFAIF
mmetsp:Transcript_12347/g.46027  ORF Transcript_12347/g.46027 Transcript_12347/m.46027 type:complete len:295 (-) Transcript_12347:2180-3064(-)